jgi:uncharacterized membrane protein
MKGFFEFFKTTAAGGFFVILPIVVVVLLLGQALAMLDGLMTPLAESLPVERVGGVEVVLLLSLLAVAALCFAAGLVLRTGIGARSNAWLERVILERVPGYTMVRNLTGRFAGAGESSVALARLQAGGSLALVFVVEHTEDGHVVVFQPLAPTPTVGSLHVVPEQDVRVLEVSMAAGVNCVMQWGVGAAEMLAGSSLEGPPQS